MALAKRQALPNIGNQFRETLARVFYFGFDTDIAFELVASGAMSDLVGELRADDDAYFLGERRNVAVVVVCSLFGDS